MSKVKVYLPTEPVERAKVISGLMEKHKTVTLVKDEEQKLVAEVSEEQQLEIHPVTGLPVLLD
jgi:helix-turn-helix protein